ncbi:heterokaryon incompatibility protein-domain-containing protein, partial [Lasiosphaeris hirsuta]
LQSETSSSTTLDLAFHWYQSCNTSHRLCNRMRSQKKSWMPSRLLDISSESENQWKLVVVSADNITPAPYFTLSYRWGSNQSLMLRRSTLCDFRRGQQISRLPQTFQDAVVIARRFSVRYLWIDALCIMQDCREDWEREIPAMQHIYSNSVCNLAASASENPNGGLFRTRDTTAIVPGVVAAPSAASTDKNHHIFDDSYWNRQISNGPLHRRGWVFQERLLSSRVLYFGKSQIFWECFTELKCEGFPQGILEHHSVKNLNPLWDLQESGQQEGQESDKMPIHLLRLWNNLVRDYSNCALTRADDKLPAFVGIANLFGEVTGDVYLAGMWRSSLLEQLNWWVDQPRCRISTTYRAPSWSWASLDGPIRPHHQAARTQFLVSITAVTTDHSSHDLAGTVSLHLRGSLTINTQLEQPLQAILYPDSLEIKLDASRPFYFLPLQTASYELLSDAASDHGDLDFHMEVSCLLLEAVLCAVPPIYRRVGHCVIDDEDDISMLGLCVVEDRLASVMSNSDIILI